MNTKRSDFITTRKLLITPYWLLGFVDPHISLRSIYGGCLAPKAGEGSFFISKRDNYRLIFSLSQSIKDLALMSEIKTFFYKRFSEDKSDLNYISFVISKETNNSRSAVQIIISRDDIISNKLIPFFLLYDLT